MDLKKELGEKIKRFRKIRGLTQEQLAEMIDISARNLSNIEQGISFAKAETLENILKSLNISTQDLFSNNHIKSNEELLNEINKYVELAKNDNKKLELIYKILKSVMEEV